MRPGARRWDGGWVDRNSHTCKTELISLFVICKSMSVCLALPAAKLHILHHRISCFKVSCIGIHLCKTWETLQSWTVFATDWNYIETPWIQAHQEPHYRLRSLSKPPSQYSAKNTKTASNPFQTPSKPFTILHLVSISPPQRLCHSWRQDLPQP